MAYDLISKNFIETYPNLKVEDIVAFDLRKKENGEQIGVITLVDGRSIVKNITPDGLIITTYIEIPNFAHNIELRNKFICDLYNIYRYRQADIAKFMLMSQSQISNIITKNRR